MSRRCTSYITSTKMPHKSLANRNIRLAYNCPQAITGISGFLQLNKGIVLPNKDNHIAPDATSAMGGNTRIQLSNSNQQADAANPS